MDESNKEGVRTVRFVEIAEMTISGYHVVMKRAGIAELKSRLSEFLRAVREGDTVTVLDRDKPVAKIVPIQEAGLRVRKPVPGSPRPNRVPLPPPLESKIDILQVLLEERQVHR